MLMSLGKLFGGNQDADLHRLMRTEFARDYRQIQRMNNGHVDARAYLDQNLGRSRRD